MAEGMLAVDEARARILGGLQPLPAETVELEAALGRALAEDVAAARTVPPWDNSAMDGYAVRAEDVAQVPVRLRIVETVVAGRRPTVALTAGTCARIMTGAPVPEGCDAVVMQEKTRALPPDAVEILAAARPGTNVRRAGEDARAGDVLLPRGTAVGIPELGLLVSQGLLRVPVPRRPRVGVLSTGDELRAAGSADDTDAAAAATGGAAIIDANGPALLASVRRAGGEPVALGIARDRQEDVEAALEKARGLDVVLTTAGVSVGDRDVVRPALERLGVAMDFWKVALKPGKPLAVGRWGQTLVFGMPGNPTSALVSFELFVRPALRRLLGHADAEPPRVSGRLEVEVTKAAGLAHFVRVAAHWRDGALWARPLTTQTSGALRSASRATHLLHVPAAADRLAPGDWVELLPLSWGG